MQKEVPSYANFVGGKWVTSESHELITSINPATGEAVAHAQKSTSNDMKAAIEAAEATFDKTNWRYDPNQRAAALRAMAEGIRKAADNLAMVDTLETGKTVQVAKFEILRGADIVEYFAGLCKNLFGRSSSDLSRDTFDVVVREPMGVVGIISPWNFPFILLLRSLAPALAAGNTVVTKPASYTPAINAELMKIISLIPEFEKGAVNCVAGPGGTVGRELASSSKVSMISFTGNLATGKEIMQMASNNVKKVDLELGGKSPSVVFDDARLDDAVRGCLSSAWFSCASQVCYASTRFIVQRSIHQQFTQKLKEHLARLKVGNGLDDGVEVGPVISQSQLDDVLNYIELGKHDSKLLTGGDRLVNGNLQRGFFVAPTLFDDVPHSTKIAQEEIFGPVLSVSEFDTVDESIEMANDTIYGLAGAVWTENVNVAMKVAKGIRAGTVWVNNYSKIPPSLEYGGYKQSGIGRVLGIDGLYESTQLKHIGIYYRR